MNTLFTLKLMHFKQDVIIKMRYLFALFVGLINALINPITGQYSDHILEARYTAGLSPMTYYRNFYDQNLVEIPILIHRAELSYGRYLTKYDILNVGIFFSQVRQSFKYLFEHQFSSGFIRTIEIDLITIIPQLGIHFGYDRMLYDSREWKFLVRVGTNYALMNQSQVRNNHSNNYLEKFDKIIHYNEVFAGGTFRFLLNRISLYEYLYFNLSPTAAIGFFTDENNYFRKSRVYNFFLSAAISYEF